MKLSAAVGALLLFAALPAQGGEPAEPTYTLTDLGAAPRGVWPFGVGVLKMGINNQGDVAASRAVVQGFGGGVRSQALLYRHGRIVLIDPGLVIPPGDVAIAAYGSAVNNKGLAVGFEKDAPSQGPLIPFLFNAKGKIKQLPTLTVIA